MESITEWIGAVLGVIGSLMVAKKIQIRWAFMAWIISDISLMIFAILICRWGLLTLCIVYLGVSIYGWFNWKPERIETNYG